MWKRIAKEKSIFPTTGTYSDWKPQLSVEGYNQCVYCYVSESYFGGIRNFHVEHYQPKSKFAVLTNDYKNLFFSCSICNIFKSDDWPNDSDTEYKLAFYPNPSMVDYSEIFEVNPISFYITGKNFTAKYLVNKLFLNRKQLVIFRKTNFADEKYKIEFEKLKKLKSILFDKIEAYENIKDCVQCLRKVEKIMISLDTAYRKKDSTIPYSRADITR